MTAGQSVRQLWTV